MDFDFDPLKSASNKSKHGIDFVAAQALWRDEYRLELMAESEDEPRYYVIGRIGERHWTAIVTNRAGRVRIISVRRARAVEKAIYEGG